MTAECCERVGQGAGLGVGGRRDTGLREAVVEIPAEQDRGVRADLSRHLRRVWPSLLDDPVFDPHWQEKERVCPVHQLLDGVGVDHGAGPNVRHHSTRLAGRTAATGRCQILRAMLAEVRFGPQRSGPVVTDTEVVSTSR